MSNWADTAPFTMINKKGFGGGIAVVNPVWIEDCILTPTCQWTLAADLLKTLQISPWHHLLGLDVPKSLMSTLPQYL